jgi:hypothetical protein
MSLEEAERIARSYLPDEPRQDDLAAWRASRPRPEPKREPRRLDTQPAAPPIDLAAVVRGALLGERSLMTEAFGEALGEYGNGLLDQVEGMIAATAAGLHEDLSRQIDQLRAELSARIDEMASESAANVALIHGQGERLKAQLEAVIAKKTRARAARPNGGSLLSLPAPTNGHAQ